MCVLLDDEKGGVVAIGWGGGNRVVVVVIRGWWLVEVSSSRHASWCSPFGVHALYRVSGIEPDTPSYVKE